MKRSTLSLTGNDETAYHVMITAKLTTAAIIDGFTFIGVMLMILVIIPIQVKSFIEALVAGNITQVLPQAFPCIVCVCGNTATNSGNNVQNNNSSTSAFQHCIVKGSDSSSSSSSSWNSRFGTDQDGNLNAAPLFLDSNNPTSYNLLNYFLIIFLIIFLTI